MSEETIDLTRGLYRRIYANFIVGRRINAVPLEAEAWFWRILSVADDFGNLTGDASLLYVATVGRRVAEISIDQVKAWTAALLNAELLDTYTVGNDTFLHVRGFLDTQSAGINGKRVRRVPASPWDPGEPKRSRVNPGESKRAQVNPGGNKELEPKPEPEVVVVGKRDPSPDAVPATTTTGAGSILLQARDRWFEVEPALIDQLQAEFPNLYVRGDILALHRHLTLHPEKQRPHSECVDSIRRWLGHAERNPDIRARPASSSTLSNGTARESAMDRKKRELDASLAGGGR